MILFARLKFHHRYVVDYLKKNKNDVKYKILINEYLVLFKYLFIHLNIYKKFVVQNNFKEIQDINDLNNICNIDYNLKEYYFILNVIYNDFVIFYLEKNNYFKVYKYFCSNNSIFCIFKSNTFDVTNYLNVCLCYYNELLYYYYEFKNIIFFYKNNFIFECFQSICKSKLYYKLDICIIEFFIKISFYFYNYTIEKLYDYIFVSKLSEVLIAKNKNINISGASDIIDAKKIIMQIINIVYKEKSAKRILYIIKYVEDKYCTNFHNTILHKRLKDFLKSYNFEFISNDYILCIKLIANLQKINCDDWTLMRRLFLLFKKIKPKFDNLTIDICDIKEIKTLEGRDLLKFVILLLKKYEFKQLSKDNIDLLSNKVKNAINFLLYS